LKIATVNITSFYHLNVFRYYALRVLKYKGLIGLESQISWRDGDEWNIRDEWNIENYNKLWTFFWSYGHSI